MPTPTADETHDEFIERCIPVVLDDGTAESPDQAVAVCNSMWEDAEQGEEDNAKMKQMDYKTLPGYETKTIPTFIKAQDNELGIVDHIVAIMGNLDDGGDIIEQGAFTKTISERSHRIKCLDQHQYDSVLRVLGKPIEMREIGRTELPFELLQQFPEAQGGLLIRTQYAIETDNGRNVFRLVKGGFLPETSIGYDALDVDFETRIVDEQEITVRHLKTIRLWEYSNVIWGMNPATTTVSAKGAPGENTMDDKGVSGSTTLPIANRDRAWDASAAQNRVRSSTGSEDEPSARYRQAFFWFDGENADQFGAYKLPFADAVDGTLTAIPRGIFAVAGVLSGARGGVDIPEADQVRVRQRVSRYYARMRAKFDDDSIVPPWEKAAQQRVMFKANLGQLVNDVVNSFYGTYPDSQHVIYWVKEIWDEFIIVEQEGAAGRAMWKIAYAIDDGKVSFASHDAWEQVSISYTPIPKSAKIGRAISRRNATRIQAAIDGAQSALDTLEQLLTDAGITADEEQETEEEASKSAPGVQAALENQAAEAGPDSPPTLDAELAIIEIEKARLELNTMEV